MEAFKDEKNFGPYQLHAKIAEGGMAEVILGTSQQREFQGQFLAIKRLRTHLNSNRPFVNLLIHEAKIGVLLNHPGIATVYDLGSYKSEFFLTMEYVHGKSVDRVIERIDKLRSPKISIEVATYIILEILKALAFAHQLKDSKGRELNIIHRDISPGNILLSYRGEVKLADFGIATAETRLQPNFSHLPMGKIAYMAPEQIVNDPVVKATDLYSLGVVYYQLLSGQLPFHADNANNLFKKVVDGRVTDLRMTGPTLSQGLRDIVTRCLNRSASKRYQTAPELYQAIVDHFNQEYELDFNSKAIRQYYKKKLSEYLRASFESEIIQEIEITQDCLKRGTSRDDFKVTAPQDLKRLADFEREGGMDATILEEDLTNEATRHFPLTEEERQQILKGIPPQAAIQETRRVIQSKAAAAGASFDLQTIPEYDLAIEDSALRRISVNDKLKLSSLDKDQKETLKQQAPEIEIASEQDLAAFEQNTFSGRRPAEDPNSTREMSKAEIIRDFKEIEATQKNQNLTDDETIMDTEALRPPKSKETPKVKIANLNRFKTVERTAPSRPRPSTPRSYRLLVVTLSLVLISLAVTLWLRPDSMVKLELQSERADEKISRSFPALISSQKIKLISSGEVSTDIQKKFVQSLQDGSDSLSGITNMFESEYRKYKGKDQTLIQFDISEPVILSKHLSLEPSAARLIKSSEIISFFESQGLNLSSSEPTVFLYFYSYDPNSTQNPIFPDRAEIPQKNIGIVFVPTHLSKKLIVLESIAREIAFLFGAKNKEDLVTGLAIAPSGLANPKEVPLYPQSKAELMGRDIALNVLQERPISTLKEIVIGTETAKELGWID